MNCTSPLHSDHQDRRILQDCRSHSLKMDTDTHLYPPRQSNVEAFSEMYTEHWQVAVLKEMGTLLKSLLSCPEAPQHFYFDFWCIVALWGYSDILLVSSNRENNITHIYALTSCFDKLVRIDIHKCRITDYIFT